MQGENGTTITRFVIFKLDFLDFKDKLTLSFWNKFRMT